MLVLFYGLKRTQLIAFSHGGKRLADKVIIASYKKLLRRFEKKEILLRHLEIVGSLLAQPHLWRGDKESKAGKADRITDRGCINPLEQKVRLSSILISKNNYII